MAKRTERTVTELLHEQHEQIRALFDEVSALSGKDRVETFHCLRAFLAVHETAEEEVVHPAVQRRGGKAAEAVRARLQEEDKAKRLLAELEKIGPDGDGFGPRFDAFRDAVLEHADAEEREVFPVLDAEEDIEMLATMGRALVAAERIAPTHAHPHAPESAIGNLLTGPLVSIVDRVRDAIKRAA